MCTPVVHVRRHSTRLITSLIKRAAYSKIGIENRSIRWSEVTTAWQMPHCSILAEAANVKEPRAWKSGPQRLLKARLGLCPTPRPGIVRMRDSMVPRTAIMRDTMITAPLLRHCTYPLPGLGRFIQIVGASSTHGQCRSHHCCRQGAHK